MHAQRIQTIIGRVHRVIEEWLQSPIPVGQHFQSW